MGGLPADPFSDIDTRQLRTHKDKLANSKNKFVSNERVTNLFQSIDRSIRSVSEQEDMINEYKTKLKLETEKASGIIDA